MTTDVAWKRRENYGCNLRNVQRILVMFSSIMFGEVDNESPFTRTEAELLEQLELWTNQKIFGGGDKLMYWWTIEIRYWCYQSSAEFAWTTNWHFLYQWCPPVTKPLDLPSYPLYNQLLVLSGSYPSPTQEQFFQLHRTWNIASTISPFLIPLLHYYGEQRSVRADIYNLTKGLLSLRVGMSHPELKFIVSKIDSVFQIVGISQIHV